MPVIKILPHHELCPEGKTIEAAPGTSICEALLENGVAIEHACDMSAACTTCHVVVKEGYASLSEVLEERLEDGVGIGRQRHPHEVHHLSVEHEWPEAETVEEEIDGLEGVCAKLSGDVHEEATIGNRTSEEIDGEEVAEGHYVAVGKVAAIFATEGEDEEHNEQNQR